MSKPRRPKYQRPFAKPAELPAESASAASVPAPDASVPALVEPEPAAFEAPAAFQEAEFHDIAPDFAAQPAESLPAQVEPVTAVAVFVPSAAITVAAPQLLGAETFSTTVMNYVIGEGEAFAAHMRALAGARSMAEFVRLQIGEFQRAADATLTCWGMLTVSAGRAVATR